MSLKFGLKITSTVDEIRRKIMISLRDDLRQALKSARPIIEDAIRNRSIPFFDSSKEARALVHGPLDAEFGFYPGEGAVKVGAIIQVIINNIQVEYKDIRIVGDNFGGGLTVYVLKEDFSDVLSHAESVQPTVKGINLPWLEWLLLEGNKIIISDYQIQYGRYSKSAYSRSGKAIMVKKKTGIWRVPAVYAGTLSNNWLTRAVLDLSGAYEDMILTVMQEKIEDQLVII
jgi:hypothetical protein